MSAARIPRVEPCLQYEAKYAATGPATITWERTTRATPSAAWPSSRLTEPAAWTIPPTMEATRKMTQQRTQSIAPAARRRRTLGYVAE